MYLAAGVFVCSFCFSVKMATQGLGHVDFCFFSPILGRLRGLRVKVGEGGVTKVKQFRIKTQSPETRICVSDHAGRRKACGIA